MFVFFFFKQKTAYEMRMSDWSSDVCSSDLGPVAAAACGARDGKARGVAVGPRHADRAQHRVEQLAGGAREEGAALLIVHFGPGGEQHQRRTRFAHRQHTARVPLAAGHVGAGCQPVLKFVPVARKSVVSGKSVSVRVDSGGRRIIKKKKQKE